MDLPAVRLSTLFNQLFRQLADVSLLCPYFALYIGNGIFTVSSIGDAVRLGLRSRLTLIRLALIRNPWSYGEGVSRPLYRYLYLHLLFHKLQQESSLTFNADGMLPYRYNNVSHGFGNRFNTRLLSTHGPSTSELLRTL